MHTLGLTVLLDWRTYKKSGRRPANIPATPDKVYGPQWISWADWLVGDPSGEPRTQRARWLPFEDARAYAHTLQLPSVRNWTAFAASSERPRNIPSNPQTIYAAQWKGWRDWLRPSKS